MRHALILMLLSAVAASAQPELTLDTCLARAYVHHAYERQHELHTQITGTNVGAVEKTYLPTVELNGFATYQNEQVSIPAAISIPGYTPPAAPLNFNQALVTIRQWIYDGNTMSSKRAIEEATGKVQQQDVEVQRLQTKTAVMQQYFVALLVDRQLVIIKEKQDVLNKRLSEVEAAVKNSLLLQSDADMLRAQIVRLDQQRKELNYTRSEAVRGLSTLTGSSIDPDTRFVEPTATVAADTSMDLRPDLVLMDRQQELLEAQKDAATSMYLPRIGVFADLGIGYPGYNIFSTSVAPMARIGLQLNWKIFDWGQGGAQQQSLSLSQELIRIKKEQVRTKVTVQTEAQLNTIAKMQDLIKNDEELVRLYSSVSRSYESQLRNGVITSADYIAELSREQEAQADLELHKMQMLVAIMNYNTLLGK